MAAIIINNSGQYTWGSMTNRMVSGIVQANTAMQRLNDAIATASSGYTGTPGTQFEVPSNMMGAAAQNLFGVVADVESPGAQGEAYAYAVGELHNAWEAFWAAAQQYIEALDNGTFV